MISDAEYFSHLYDIARALNKEFSLHSALKKALERAVDLLELETGWIWLLQGDKSVYLAASYNLPPALKDHPERLSGWCFCVEKYLSNNIQQARNISEIACSRLKNIKSGTQGLKFHATVPISIGEQKVGLINLLSRESHELNEKQLSVLNTIGELIGIAIQRTQGQERYSDEAFKGGSSVAEILKRVVAPKLEEIHFSLAEAKTLIEEGDLKLAHRNITAALQETATLTKQASHILDESAGIEKTKTASGPIHFPATPLTKRELELLALVKKGFTNKQIAETLFISERTVKFHITSILSKLFARTRTEAVNIAIQRGLIGF